jgi:hypothetical protein
MSAHCIGLLRIETTGRAGIAGNASVLILGVVSRLAAALPVVGDAAVSASLVIGRTGGLGEAGGRADHNEK